MNFYVKPHYVTVTMCSHNNQSFTRKFDWIHK